MTHSEEILAGLPAAATARATCQGQLGYWVQADAIFIAVGRPDPGLAIDLYRAKLATGDIGVSQNGFCDGVNRLKLVAELATQATALAAAEAEVARLRGGVEYVQTASCLPDIGRPVLLQPRHEWAVPEMGRRLQDEHGDYWRVNGQRSTRYDLSNWQGWFPIPNAPAAPQQEGSERDG